MTSFRRFRFTILITLSGAALFAAGIATRATLAPWIQTLEGSGRFEAVFFRSVTLLDGQVSVCRLPGESRQALNELAAKSPGDAEVYLMRARVDESQLDFAAAEADWQKYAQLAADKAQGQEDLADFYGRRLRPLDQAKALAAAAQVPSTGADALLPATQQRAWHEFEKILTSSTCKHCPIRWQWKSTTPG